MKTVHVAVGIIRKEGSDELLAVQRGYGDMQGLWEFPGGKLMRGETPEDAVRRELMEELQVKVTNLRDFYTVEYDYPRFPSLHGVLLLLAGQRVWRVPEA